MERLGFPRPPPDRVRVMVGHGLEKLLEKAVGPDLAPEGVRLFRERYPQVAVEKTELLPGVPEVLAELAARGYPMAVASNKPALFSRLILDAKGVGHYFEAIEGPDAETPTKPDPTMLFRMMERLGHRPEGTVVVGDMEVDVQLAWAAGCRVVLVPGGSQPREELEKLDADALLEKLLDLPAWLEQVERRDSRV
jgi:phosphoglycolate phosphatase